MLILLMGFIIVSTLAFIIDDSKGCHNILLTSYARRAVCAARFFLLHYFQFQCRSQIEQEPDLCSNIEVLLILFTFNNPHINGVNYCG